MKMIKNNNAARDSSGIILLNISFIMYLRGDFDYSKSIIKYKLFYTAIAITLADLFPHLGG